MDIVSVAVRLDHHHAVEHGDVRGDPRKPSDNSRLGHLRVAVAHAAGDDRHLWRGHVQELRGRPGIDTMVRHLQHVYVQVEAEPHHRRLRLGLDVPGEKEARPLIVHPQHQAAVVLQGGVRIYPHHLEGDVLRQLQIVPGVDGGVVVHRATLVGDGLHDLRIHGRVYGIGHPRHVHRQDIAVLQHLRGKGDVVGVRVGYDEGIYRGHVQIVQEVHGAGGVAEAPGVDQYVLTVRGLDQYRQSVTDVEETDDQLIIVIVRQEGDGHNRTDQDDGNGDHDQTTLARLQHRWSISNAVRQINIVPSASYPIWRHRSPSPSVMPSGPCFINRMNLLHSRDNEHSGRRLREHRF